MSQLPQALSGSLQNRLSQLPQVEIFSSKAEKSLPQMPQDLFQTSKNILSQMPQDFLFKPFKISCHNCHRPSEIFSGKVKKSLSQMPQDFFQTIQNLLSHLPQAQLFFLWHLWQEMLRSLKKFCARKVIVTNATRFFFKPLKTSCHNCHKIGECLLPQG